MVADMHAVHDNLLQWRIDPYVIQMIGQMRAKGEREVTMSTVPQGDKKRQDQTNKCFTQSSQYSYLEIALIVLELFS